MLLPDLTLDEQQRLADLLARRGTTSPLDLWRECTRFLRQTEAGPDGYWQVWQNCFDDWPVDERGPAPMWSPDVDEIREANLSQWAGQSGVETQDFHRWTVNHREDFWGEALERLGILFENKGPRLDCSAGVEHARWFPDAQMNIVESCFLSDPEAVALVFQAPGQPLRQRTYRELREEVNQVSNSLVAAGFQAGDAIAVFMPMTHLSVAIYLGIVQAGCVVVSIADSFAPPEIATRLDVAQAKAVITYDHQVRAGKKLPLYQAVVDATDQRAIVIGFEGGPPAVSLRAGDQSWSEFLCPDTVFQPVTCSADQAINILFSSGTTGQPKAIPWSHLTPIKCAVDGFCHQDIRPGQVCVWPTNLGWMMGPWLIFASLLNRATIGLYEDAPLGRGFGQFVQDARVQMLGVVPTIVKAWRTSGQMETFDWSEIRLFSSTGESSQRDDMFYLSSLAQMKPVIEYCGGTEIGGGYITSVITEPNVPAAFNTAAVGLEFVILDETDRPAMSGELFLVPPSVGLSDRLLNRDHYETYFGGTPTLAEHLALRRHGDHFQAYPSTVTGHSVYMAGGRVDDTMNLGGIKTSSSEIERVLNQVEEVRETAAVAFAENGPAELVVFMVLDNGGEGAALDELKHLMNQRLKKQLNPLFRISRLIDVDHLPRTASGKVMRRKLRADIE
ncbi:MAG: AMP-binding protein [Planctomycetota bacterium]|nr:AMP-binding protein [Planctomycetota bacterium]